jgi:hypothetical protein
VWIKAHEATLIPELREREKERVRERERERERGGRGEWWDNEDHDRVSYVDANGMCWDHWEVVLYSGK